jgi:hypothetical protein
MIILYSGKRGTGKTLTMVKDAINFYSKGWNIYSNMLRLKIPHVYMSEEEMLNIDKESNLFDCVFLVDEIGTLLDNRRSMSKNNINFSHFIQQIRKRNIVLLATTQYNNTIDLRFKQHLDVEVRPRYDNELKIIDAEYIDITSGEQSINNIGMGIPKIYKSVRLVFEASKVFGYYDTNELISTRKV